MALWSRITKNPDVSTGPLARPFARWLAPLNRSIALPYLLCLRAPLRSLVCSLAHSAHPLARETVNDWTAIYSVFFSILAHSAMVVVVKYDADGDGGNGNRGGGIGDKGGGIGDKGGG